MININEDVKNIMKLIESSGYEVYITGGFVRDSIIGRESNDYDLCTNMPLEKLKEIYPYLSMMSVNEHRKTGIVNVQGIDVEISEFKGNNLIEDLLLRDVTMNSIALSIDGNLTDPLNGVEDIKNKIIRINPKTIDYDARAILRVIRFDGILDFEVEEKSLEELFQKRELVKNVHPDRIRKDLLKILQCENSGDLLGKYNSIFLEVIPELKELFQYEIPHNVIEMLNNTSSNIYIKFAILFYNNGKINNCTNEEIIENFLLFAKRLKLDKNIKQNVKKLLLFYDKELSIEPVEIAKTIKEIGIENLNLLFELKLASVQSKGYDLKEYVEQINELRNTYLKFMETKPVLGIRDLCIDGRSLSQMDFDSKLVGIILNDVLDKVMNKQLSNEKEEIEEYVEVKYR